MENLFAYTPVQWDIVSHILVFGVGAHVAGFVYFLVTSPQSAPRYRLSSFLSAVVMVSAALILFQQQLSWREAFVFDGELWRLGDSTFSNGFRYVNWTIDVPVLLTQLLVVLGVSHARFMSIWPKFVIGGLLMIWTGYVGQFFETTSATNLYIWGTISTVFYFYILYLVYTAIFPSLKDLPKQVHGSMKGVWWLILFSWTLYPGAYLMPVLWPAAEGMVARQIVFTAADVLSKVIYGVMLSRIATTRSALEGFEPAIAALRGSDSESVASAATGSGKR